MSQAASGHVARPASPRAAAAIAVAGIAVWLACALIPADRPFALPDHGDIGRYFGYAERTLAGEVPYRDLLVEYPPGFLPVILAPAPADQGYYDRFRALMLVVGAAIVALVVAALARAGATATELAAAVLVPATLPRTLTSDLVFDRFDLWPAGLVLLSVTGLLYGRRRLGLAALGVAAAAKVFPLAVVPLVALRRRGRAAALRDVAVVAGAAAALVVPFALIAPFGVARVGWLLVHRDLHVESLGGSLLLVAHRLGVYEPTIYISHGVGNSWDLAGPAAQVVALAGSLAQVFALATVWYLFARSPRGPRDFLLAVAATVAAFVAFGKVLSPQYLVWVAALVPLTVGRARAFALPATVVAALLTRQIYLYGYDDVIAAGQWSWVLLARNLVLVGIFSSLVVALATSARAAPAGLLRAAPARGLPRC